MAMDLKEIEKLIKEALSDAVVEIQDCGDGNHYSATVISHNFQVKVKLSNIKWYIIRLKAKWVMNYTLLL